MVEFHVVLHYGLHFIAPVGLAYFFFRKIWKKAYLIMFTTMLVDLDHLLADPIFDPERCGIGFHPLHSEIAIAVYVLMLFVSNTYVRIVAAGLLFHMLTDGIDCVLM